MLVELRCAFEHDIALLDEFAGQRLHCGLADLDTAAGQVPARDIAVLDQEDAVGLVEDDGADTECHTAGESRVEMQCPANGGLKSSPHDGQGRNRS